ncbi:MAG: ATP-binding protein [Thermoleophilaceae bacterium]|nr:ATP-binding protein [Thermoleophilaceae bacterium]
MIVTSNRRFEAWGEILGDAMVAAALIDGLIHHAHMIALNGARATDSGRGDRHRSSG